MSFVRRHFVSPLADGRTARQLGLVASAIPLGTAWFVMLVTGWSLGLGLLITLLGIPILLGLAYAVRECARFERGLLDMVVGTRLSGPARPLWTGSVLGTLSRQAVDPAFWRDQAYLLLRFVVGLPLACLVLGVIGFALQLILAPTYYRADDPLDGGFWNVDTLPESLAVVPAGLLLLFLAIPLTDGAGRAWVRLATGVLGVGSPAAARGRRVAAAPAPGPAPHRVDPRRAHRPGGGRDAVAGVRGHLGRPRPRATTSGRSG